MLPLFQRHPVVDFTLPPSLWTATAIPAPRLFRLEGEREVDLVVIGGGFSGLSTALFARQRGMSVAVLEAAEVGWGASGRNNGQVIPTLSKRDPADILARFGRERGERLIGFVRDSADLLFQLVRELGIPCEAEQTGWVQPAHSPGRLAISRRRYEAWGAHGARVQFYDRSQMAELLGSEAWHGGWGNLSGGHVNPLSLARGLATVIERMGAFVFVRTPARKISHKWDRWEVTTPSGRIHASRLVLATNAYTDDLWPGLRRTVVPVTSWQMATHPLGENMRHTIVPGRQAVSDTRGDLGFFRYDAQHRLVTGGSTMWPRPGVEQKIRETAAERLSRWFPQLGRTRFEYVWSGRLAITQDFFPHLHQIGEGAFTWLGCNGRGVALSLAMGRELARLAGGEPAEDMALPLTKLQPIRWHMVTRHLAPPLALWGYRRADRREVR
jgi:glycine/D-amino acid oxidase-like deaminating enzyme